MSLPIGVNTGALRPSVLQKISLPRFGSSGREALSVAPIIKVDTRQGFYHYFAENDALMTGAPGNPANGVGYDTPASAGGLRITSSTYQSSIYRLGQMNFSMKQISEFEARGSDILATYSQKLQTQGVQLHAALTGTAISAAGNYVASSGLPVATNSAADIQGTINGGLIGLAQVGSPITEGRWVACCNLSTANILLSALQVQGMGYALASDSQATGYAKTGVADMSQLRTFFASRLIAPIELVVFPHYLPTPTNPTGAPVVADGVLGVFKVAEAYGDSGFLQTMTPDPSAATGVVQTYTVNNPYGVGMHLEADFGVTVLGGTANKFGFQLFDINT